MAHPVCFYKILTLSIWLWFLCPMSNAAEDAFPRTPSGEFEVKVLPAGILIEVVDETAGYFDSNNQLFRKLFRYIRRQDISMTAPVEAGINPARMAFWVGSGDHAKLAHEEEGVRVVEVEERQVASLGVRGGYSQANFERNRKRLLEWIDDQETLVATGDPYAVYWNGPFVPWFIKRSEIHVPVREAGGLQ